MWRFLKWYESAVNEQLLEDDRRGRLLGPIGREIDEAGQVWIGVVVVIVASACWIAWRMGRAAWWVFRLGRRHADGYLARRRARGGRRDPRVPKEKVEA